MPSPENAEGRKRGRKDSKRSEEKIRREAIRRSHLMMPSKEASFFSSRYFAQLYGQWQPRMGFDRYATICLANGYDRGRAWQYFTVGPETPPSFDDQREAKINMPVTWPAFMPQAFVFEEADIWTCRRQNGYIEPVQSFHLEVWVDPGDKSYTLGWTNLRPHQDGKTYIECINEQHYGKADGLWLVIREVE